MIHFQKKLSLLLLILLLFSNCSVFKKLPKGNKKNNSQTQIVSKPKASISAFFTNPPSLTKKGMIGLYVSNNRYYFEVSDSLLKKDLLSVSRISKAASTIREGMTGYAGDHINTAMIRFEKGPNQKIFLRHVFIRDLSKDSTQDMYRLVERSNLHPIIGSFDIKAFSADSSSYLIDMTDFINADNEYLFFSKSSKLQLKLQSQQADKSYVNQIQVYPKNVEISAVKTYATDKGLATFELNSSIIVLPEEQMVARYFDNRVGYFATGFMNYDENPQGVEYTKMITRWRLEPKEEDLDRYKNGELVDPKKPIIYYIDPETPKKWVPYLIQGVNDWQDAFIKAGFKNAIMAKVAPTREEDSTWSLEDARYSAIVYKPSSIANASGPHICDPRSGEILESHVNWYHNMMSALRNWYFIQCAAADPSARKMIFNDSLMGQLIRYVCAHEIGHTLGLRHNFGASFSIPVEKLRDSTFLKEHGHTSSIMDYARFNFVAQPEDSIQQRLLIPKIGVYDHWAIEWGYRLFLDINDPLKELSLLNQRVIDSSKNPKLWFGRENNANDPRSQPEDLSNNQMLANAYGVKNLKIITDSLVSWTKEPNKEYQNLSSLYSEIITQYARYAVQAVKWIGGIYENPKRVEEEGPIYTYVEKAKQKEAMQYLNTYIFTTPKWLFNPDIFALINMDSKKTMNFIHFSVINALINPRVIGNLIEAETLLGKEAYSPIEFFDELHAQIFPTLLTGAATSPYQRNLQKIYIDGLLSTIPFFNMPYLSSNSTRNASPTDYSDLSSLILFQLKSLEKKLRSAKPTDPFTKAHYLYLAEYIKNNLEN